MRIPDLRDIKIELSRREFWSFCKTISPDFYKESRPHLRQLCDRLNDFYHLNDYNNLIIQMPPRHGKSRTLTNFSAWILGKNEDDKIITASFDDALAQDFSRHTRDIIQEEKGSVDDIVYSDIFDSRIKQGDASYKKWALQGKFFSYKGCGINGSVTGRGGNWIIIDDPIKDAATAYNPLMLEKIWLWYTGTMLSRQEKGCKKIICMTPWAKDDLASRLLLDDDWDVITMPALKDDGTMLCDDLLSRDGYEELKKVADENIFMANYQMQRLDIKGKLYSSFKTYTEIPKDKDGNEVVNSIVSYTDTADEGTDYLCTIYAKKSMGYLYVTDVYYTQDPQEVTEGETCDRMMRNGTRVAHIESNNGGRGFARNVRAMILAKGGRCQILWFHQSKNKRARILTEAPTVQEFLLFPENWKALWPKFYEALNTYQKEGKNKHDDAPDAVTGLIEKTHVRGGAMHVPDMRPGGI